MSDKVAYPGQWTWYWREENGEANCGVVWEKRPGMAYSVCRAPRYESRDQWEANARLIAAAPELLDVAMRLVAGYDALDYDIQSEARQAREIISKATGGAQ